MTSAFHDHGTNDRRRASAEANHEYRPAKKSKKRGASYDDRPTVGGTQRGTSTPALPSTVYVEAWFMPNVVCSQFLFCELLL